MAHLLLISGHDFTGFVPFTLNIGAHLLAPHIQAAQLFDVRPLFTAPEWGGFERNLGALAPEFPGLEFNAAEYLATPVASGWDDAKLANLWAGFARPLLVLESFRRLIFWHGTHVTENGLESFSDGANMPVSTARRAELKTEIETQCSLYRARLANALRLFRGTLATTICSPGRAGKPGRGGLTVHAV